MSLFKSGSCFSFGAKASFQTDSQVTKLRTNGAQFVEGIAKERKRETHSGRGVRIERPLFAFFVHSLFRDRFSG
jgi:hypothetical protein